MENASTDRINRYLQRLNLAIDALPPACTGQLLNQLQYAHVTQIPYENLDILLGIPLPTTCADQYGKIIDRRRGGFCFELNGLFAGLLRDLGYKVTTYLGRYLRGETTIPMRRHRVIRAECPDGTWICDVGVGQSAPRYPLLLKPGLIQEQFGEIYKIEPEPFLGWVIYDFHNGEWRRFYSFTEEEQLEIDFVMPSFYCERSPDSIFNKTVMLSIKTADGRKTLDSNRFRVFARDGVTEEQIMSLDRLNTVIRAEFLIDCQLGSMPY